MKQLLQHLNTGRMAVADVPAPLCPPGHVRIATSLSLVSPGTERMLVDFARGSLLSKALQQPEKVREAWRKVGVDGLGATVAGVRRKLDEPLPLGYASVGRVIDTGAGVGARFARGDRVVCNGPHAEVVVAGVNLCARIPDQVTDEAAAFTVLGAIALQGVRLAQPTLGEAFAVFGLGAIGLLAVQLLRASGCRVLAIDPDPARQALARGFGAETPPAGADPLASAEVFSRGRGLDGVLLTLSSASHEPVSQAARMCRKRARIVLVGVTGLRLRRADFYQKEITFQVSCSYGPGRYDPAYEQAGQDYPVGFVRWTEQRNFEAVLDMMALGQLDTAPLVTHRFAVADAPQAYELLRSPEPPLGLLIEYPGFDEARAAPETTIALQSRRRVAAGAGSPAIGLLGAGGHGRGVLAGALAQAGARLVTVVSAGGVSAAHCAATHGFESASSDPEAVIGAPDVEAVVIATRHGLHASQTCAALLSGQHVFVEKPLCLTSAELDEIAAVATRPGAPLLMVGFNRRFSPLVTHAKALLATAPGPKLMVMTVNAGQAARDHWTQDPQAGGGRILGEACHFVDLLRHLSGAPLEACSADGLPAAAGLARTDNASIRLRFADGSVGVVNYAANGHRSFPKERLQVFCAGRVLELDNFRILRGYGWPGFRAQRLLRQDKGQAACVAAFVRAVRAGGEPPIPLQEILEVSRAAIVAAEQAG